MGGVSILLAMHKHLLDGPRLVCYGFFKSCLYLEDGITLVSARLPLMLRTSQRSVSQLVLYCASVDELFSWKHFSPISFRPSALAVLVDVLAMHSLTLMPMTMDPSPWY